MTTHAKRIAHGNTCFEVSIETITPAKALEYLGGRILTRKFKFQKDVAYAADMTAGKWVLTHQGIAFDENGILVDGQNRLLACVSANVPFTTVVFHGVKQTSVPEVDRGNPRSLADVLSHKGGEYVKGKLTSVITNMMLSDRIEAPGTKLFSTTMFPDDVFTSFMDEYESGISFALSHLRGKNKVCTAPVKAAVAKAYYHAVKARRVKRLEDFCTMLMSGEPLDPTKDQAVLRLRKYLTDGKFDRSGGQRGVIYLKVANCIQAFFNLERVDIMRCAKRDPFPLSKPVTDFVTIDLDLVAAVRNNIAMAPQPVNAE